MKIAYYPGCSATGSSADYEKSTQAVCAALGMQMEEIRGWSCCGSTPAHAVDTQLSGALSARNLDLAARQKADMVLTPKIMGKAMSLNPAVILLSLSVWGALLGFIGLIVALPLTTLIIAYYQRYVTKEGVSGPQAAASAAPPEATEDRQTAEKAKKQKNNLAV